MATFPKSMIVARAAIAATSVPVDPEMRTAYDQLKPQERMFVEAYIAFSEDPRKAILAAVPGIDKRSQGIQDMRALELMRRPLVQAAIAEKYRRIMDRYEITADNVMQEIALMAFARMGDYVEINDVGEPFLNLNKIPEQMREAKLAAVSEVTIDLIPQGKDEPDIKRVKFKLHDKGGALDKLAKMVGAYAPNQLQLTGANGGPIQSQNTNLNVTATMSPSEAAELYQRSLEQ